MLKSLFWFWIFICFCAQKRDGDPKVFVERYIKEKECRSDFRKFDEYRECSLAFDDENPTSDFSCVRIGQTHVVCGATSVSFLRVFLYLQFLILVSILDGHQTLHNWSWQGCPWNRLSILGTFRKWSARTREEVYSGFSQRISQKDTFPL